MRGGGGDDALFALGAELQDDEIFNGGTGWDLLTISGVKSTDEIDLSPFSIVGIESLESWFVKTFVSASSLDSFRTVSAGVIQIKDSGIVDFSESSASGIEFSKLILSDSGNTVVLSHAVGWHGGAVIVDGGAGADVIKGNDSGNVIHGGGGNDTLRGGQSSDNLVGDTGNDILTGGASSDFFYFSSIGGGTDIITDFSAPQGDKLLFQGLLHGTFAYRGSAAFTAGGNSEARFAVGQMLIDTDGNGTTDIAINLTGITSASQFHASDFVFS